MDDYDVFDDLCFMRELQHNNLFRGRRPRKIYSIRNEDMDVLDDFDFRMRYRVSKDVVLSLVDRFGQRLKFESNKNNCLSPIHQILIALRFYATGSFQQTVGDLGRASQPTCSRSISRVSRCIAELRKETIFLPRTEEERKKNSQAFYEISGFPGVYGAVDCTHIKIQSPGGDTAERFRNRKGYFSLNVQTISDANLKIRDIVASWPGSAHDSTIFDHSHARAVMELNIPNYYHLVADKGYSCRSYLLTPFFEPKSPAERRFNEAHARARNPVERQYGVWKRRFPCLSVGLRTSLKHTMMIIVATAVLHNIAIDSGDTSADFPDSIDIDPDVQQMEALFECNLSGVVKRNSLVKDFFA